MYAVRLLLLTSSIFISLSSQAGQEQFQFNHNDQQRSYSVYIPESLKANPPLLLVLHGRTGTGERIAQLTGFNRRAEKHGFIVVYPNGANNQWNYLYGVPGAREGSNDPDFLAALADSITTTYKIDPKRRYVAGLSNGGFMAQQLACNYEDLFAGFASVAASAYAVMPEYCKRTKPVAALYMHGTADKLVPWEGLGVRNESGSEQRVTLSIKKSLKFWSEHNQCSPKVDIQDLLPRGKSPQTSVKIFSSNKCMTNSAVTLYAIIGGGHNWPGVKGVIPSNISGRVNMDVHASDVVWEFFSRLQTNP